LKFLILLYHACGIGFGELCSILIPILRGLRA